LIPRADTQSVGENITTGAQNTTVGEILGFASDVAVYLGKDMRQAQGYSETLIGSRMYLSEVP